MKGRIISSEDLEAVLADHRRWLESHGVLGRCADLSGYNLDGKNFREADLRMAVLRKVRLVWADLSEADFSGANLSGSHLNHADLTGTRFRGACLRGAILRRAKTHDTDFENANTTHADFRETSVADQFPSYEVMTDDLSAIGRLGRELMAHVAHLLWLALLFGSERLRHILYRRYVSWKKRREEKALVCLVLIGLSLAATPAVAETTLQQAMVRAYQTNPALQAAQAKVRAADEKVPEALSGYRPSVDAVSEVGKMQDSSKTQGVTTDKNLTPRTMGLQVVQPVFKGFQTESSVRSADRAVQIARAELDETEQNLMLETGRAFLDIVRELAVLGLMNSQEKLLDEQLARALDRQQAGLGTETDVRQAEARLEKIRAERIQTEGNLDIARAAYTRVMGVAPGDLQTPNLILDAPLSLENAVELAETKNPRVVMAVAQRDKSKAEIDHQKGSLLPEVNLVGSVSRGWEQSPIMPGREDNSQILLQMRVPLYRAGADYARVRAAQETTVQHGLEVENARRLAHEQAVRGWQTLATAQATIKARQAAIRAAELALSGVREEQKAGTRTTIDVLNAEQELLDARVGLVRARHEKDLAVLQIKASVGGLTLRELKLTPDVYDPQINYDQTRGKWVGFKAETKE